MTNCSDCRFWQPDENSDRVGKCRRHAPTVRFGGSTGGDRAVWPMTISTDCCGEAVPWPK